MAISNLDKKNTKIINKMLTDAGLELFPAHVSIVGVEHFNSANWGEEEILEDGAVTLYYRMSDEPVIIKTKKSRQVWDEWYANKYSVVRDKFYDYRLPGVLGCSSLHPCFVASDQTKLKLPKDFENWFENWPSCVEKRNNEYVETLITSLKTASPNQLAEIRKLIH